MNLKLLAGALLGAGMMAAAPANAATLFIDGGNTTTLPSGFDLTSETGLAVDSEVTFFQAATNGTTIGGGLSLIPVGATSTIRVTFLGSEAGANNTFIEHAANQGELNNRQNNVGDTVTFFDDGGFIDFLFRTVISGDNEEIENGGNSTFAPLNIAFSEVVTDSTTGFSSVIALFGDGRLDTDFDDMAVRIETIPLPAGVLLLLTALGGLGFVARRRSQLATA